MWVSPPPKWRWVVPSTTGECLHRLNVLSSFGDKYTPPNIINTGGECAPTNGGECPLSNAGEVTHASKDKEVVFVFTNLTLELKFDNRIKQFVTK